jgi:hypothetical protein
VKLARTVVAALTVIEQVAALPLHAPDQPAKVCPLLAVDVSVSCVPSTTSSLQSPLCDADEMAHEIPGPVTVPEPVPDGPPATVTTYLVGGGGGGGAKLASTLVF